MTYAASSRTISGYRNLVSSSMFSNPENSLKEHIDQLCRYSTREPQDHIPWSSLLALPQSYIAGVRLANLLLDSYFYHAVWRKAARRLFT
ncbi:hypothetical protein KCP74_06975 [Salmonella enterica subsp. enterica]|nr:hypothetical protein KCP74_06975 [Salmonella enterica subsp. enterica]